MYGVRITIFVFVILKRLNLTSCLVELSPFGDNVIATNELLIRETFNRLLNILKIVPENVTELEGHLSIHKYLTNITLQDSEILKDIILESRQSRVKDNEENYIDLINDALNDDKVDSSEHMQDEQTQQVINNFIMELEYLKSQYNPKQDVDNQILLSLNPVNDSFDNIIEDNKSTLEESFENHTSPYWIPDDGVDLSKTRRIYHGKGTRIKNFPFVAAVLLFQMFYCAGSIISSDLIITAASCLQLAWNNRLFRENPAFVTVRVGSTFHAGGGEVIPVQEVYFHPTYNPKTLGNNLCILRIKKHLKFTGKKKRRIKKIMYDTNQHALPMDTPGITIVGWGAKEASNIMKFQEPVHYALLDIYPLRDCQEVYSKQYVKKQHFCAGFISKGGGACNHDVGNPGIVGGVLVGVVTFGAPICGTPDAPTVFTKIGYYSDWIEEIIELDVPTAHVRTTTKEPWTSPTPRSTTTPQPSVTPYNDLNELLRTYFNKDKMSYQGFLKTLTEKDFGLLVNGLQNMPEGQKHTPITEKIKTTVATTSSYNTDEHIDPGSDEETAHTQAEPFEDTFETYTKKKHKKKRNHKHRNQVKSKQQELTTASTFGGSDEPEPMIDNYGSVNVIESDEVLLVTPLPVRHKYQHRGGKKSIQYLKRTNDLENLNLKRQNEKNRDSTKIALTEYVYLDFNPKKEEIPVKTKLRTTNKPMATLVYPQAFKNISLDGIDEYDEPPAKYKDQVEAAEEFFTNSILNYLAHRPVHPFEPGDKTNSKETQVNRANPSETNSDSDDNNESQERTRSIKYNVTKNEEEENYLAYLKSLDPAQFYKLLSLAIEEIEKELRPK